MRASYPEQKPNVEDLVSSNLELVKKIAWHIYGRVHASVEIEDLIQTFYEKILKPPYQNMSIKG